MFFDWIPLDTAPHGHAKAQLQSQPQLQPQLQPQSDFIKAYPSYSQMRYDSSAGTGRIRQGKQISGSYEGGNALPDSHYERLDPCTSSLNCLFHRRANYPSVLR